MTEFFLPMIPPTVTQQEHRVGKKKNGGIYFYDSAELKEAKSKFMAYLSKHVPDKPYTGAVRLVVKWCFPLKGHSDGEYKTSKPDTDNLQKLFKDCMTKCGYWKDDAQVASEVCEKFYAKVTGIYVRIESL